MRIVLISIYLAILFTACKNSKQLAQSNKPENKPLIELNAPKTVKQNEQIRFEFINNTANEIIVHNPAFKNIERLESSKWVKVRILYCPCGADCTPPPKTKTISTGSNHTYSWNLTESWCDKKKSNNIPKTIEHKSAIGKYRTTILYSIDNNKPKKLIKEFEIIN